MEILPPIASFALPATVLLLLTLLGMRLRQRLNGRRDSEREAIDTLTGWPPEATRVLTITERLRKHGVVVSWAPWKIRSAAERA